MRTPEMTGCSYGSGKIRNFAFRGDIPFCNKICFCMAVCLWNGGEMKKGQIRTGANGGKVLTERVQNAYESGKN